MGAIISPDGVYRYSLFRSLDDIATTRSCLLWVMLNPSTADASLDDPTIRKCKGFTKRLGFTDLTVANLFALRSTKPAGLLDVADPIGPDCDDYLHYALMDCSRVIVAWGSHSAGVNKLIAARVPTVLGMIKQMRLTPECLGTAKNGAPRHPLMLAYDTQPVAFAA